jgi:protein-ribulosamine 3-kinase
MEPHYDQRQDLYRLYHQLNHAFMFGGSYRSSAVSTMKDLLVWADSHNTS